MGFQIAMQKVSFNYTTINPTAYIVFTETVAVIVL